MSPRHVPASVSELQRIGLFGSLPGETIVKLAGRMVREEFPAGTPIVVEGDLTDRFYVLISGLAAVTQEGRGARAILRPGEAFGEVAPLMRMERTATVTAMTTCVVASCDRETFTSCCGRSTSRTEPPSSATTASESSGQATLAQSPNLRVVSAAQARPCDGIDPEERAAAAEVPEHPRRGERARPVALLRSLQLDAETPVQRAEAAELGQHAVEARELDGDHLVVRLGSDEARVEQLAPEREHVVEARVHAAAGMP